MEEEKNENRFLIYCSLSILLDSLEGVLPTTTEEMQYIFFLKKKF
jgi:hypothetical protein